METITRLEHGEIGGVERQEVQVRWEPRDQLHQGLVDRGIRVVVPTREGTLLRRRQKELKVENRLGRWKEHFLRQRRKKLQRVTENSHGMKMHKNWNKAVQTWVDWLCGHIPSSLVRAWSQTFWAELSTSSWFTSSIKMEVKTLMMTTFLSSDWARAWSRASRSVAVINTAVFKAGRENWYAGQKRDRLLSPIKSLETMSGTLPRTTKAGRSGTGKRYKQINKWSL